MEKNSQPFFHAVTLDGDKCTGCTNCIRKCPTEAIRVQNGKAHILSERCIDCGECIKICPHHAKRPIFDNFSVMDGYKYKIALPAPSLYGQFHNLTDIDTVLTGLIDIGFDDVFEVSGAAELVSEATRAALSAGTVNTPVISSACPAVVRLIQVRFPDLCDNVLPLLAPMEIAAHMAREAAREKTGLSDEDIGVFFISPCPAKVTDIKNPVSKEKSEINGVFAISEIYPKLLSAMNKITETKSLSRSGLIGVGWAGVGGESAALLNREHLAADGIENVISVLEDLEDDKLRELEFIELTACPAGCVGGVLNVENPYVARARISRLKKYLPVSLNHLSGETPEHMLWSKSLQYQPIMKLSDDMLEAMQMMNDIAAILPRLPGLDCGACGAPSCHSLAEDIVKGRADEEDCIFLIKKKYEEAEKQVCVNDKS